MEGKAKIGQMDRRITLQSFTRDKDEFGEEIETWTTVNDMWAAVDYPSSVSGESITNGLQKDITKVVFTIHWRTGVTVLNRIIYESEVHNIEAIAQQGRREYLVLTAIKAR